MLTEDLRNKFRNYLLTVGYCHSQDVEAKLQAVGHTTAIDVFACLHSLESWVLCWSSTGSNSVNRVFVPFSTPIFPKPDQLLQSRVKFTNYREERQHAMETDVTLLSQRKMVDSVAYIPLASKEFGLFGVLRVIGAASQIAMLGYKEGEIQETFDILLPRDFTDADLIPHVLGRWAGSVFHYNQSTKCIEVLLSAFSSFFSISHNMYWHRDFETDEMVFQMTTTPQTKRILGGLKSPIRSHNYMFSIVAERGASEILEEFPEDLLKDTRINPSEWTPTEHFSRLKHALGCEKVSYVGVPLKVDDAVIGVMSIMTTRGQPFFLPAAQFVRSALAEMGRTIDKSAVMRTSRIIRKFASEKSSANRKEIHLPSLGQKLVTKLVRELLPHNHVDVGFIEARLGAADADRNKLPTEFRSFIDGQLIDLVVREEVALFSCEPKQQNAPYTAMLVVPVSAALPFVLYVRGPFSIISGRSLRAALEELQAVLVFFLAASEQALSAGSDISNWRQHLLLWSHVHDIKNSTAAFGTPISDLLSVARNGTHDDLRREIFAFKERVSNTISDFKAKCEETLRGAGFRKRESVKIIEVLRRAWTVTRGHPDIIRSCVVEVSGQHNSTAITYPQELEIVLSNLFLNVMNHFRRTRPGNVSIDCSMNVEENTVTIAISDNVPEKGAVRDINRILDDSNSNKTLRRFIKPIVNHTLQGEIWAEPNISIGSVVMKIRFPINASIQ